LKTRLIRLAFCPIYFLKAKPGKNQSLMEFSTDT
jgi:hypothetical protein